MRERPILFSAPMVRALLAGTKTQTRRVAKLPAQRTQRGEWEPLEFGGDGCFDRLGRPITDVTPALSHSITGTCIGAPFGVGDRLWVRETWSADFADHYPHERVWFAADDDRRSEIEVRDGVRGIFSPESKCHVPFRWHPSIHMPRWASRITLEVTGVRVERLQAISEADAQAEGVARDRGIGCIGWWRDYNDTSCAVPSARDSFMTLWESINGAESWAANPWVWVVEFKAVTL